MHGVYRRRTWLPAGRALRDLGPAMPGNCAKFGDVQDVLASADQGATWRMVTNPAVHANTCTAAYLISLGSD